MKYHAKQVRPGWAEETAYRLEHGDVVEICGHDWKVTGKRVATTELVDVSVRSAELPKNPGTFVSMATLRLPWQTKVPCRRPPRTEQQVLARSLIVAAYATRWDEASVEVRTKALNLAAVALAETRR